MAIKWEARPPLTMTAPYDGELVVIAVPNFVGESSREQLEPDAPYYLYFARWHREAGCWVTMEANEETGGPVRFAFERVAFWSDANLPTGSPPAG